MKKILLIFFLGVLFMTSCGGRDTSSTEYVEVVEYDTMDVSLSDKVDSDTLRHGPFLNRVGFLRNDLNGGYEQYELIMDLYEGQVPDGRGNWCYGTLVLYVKSPDSTEGIEVARRIINKVYVVGENEARVLMDNGGENPQSFEATITYNPENFTYQLNMEADPALVDDLMENRITLE